MFSLNTQGQWSYSFASSSYYKMFSLYWVISKNMQTCSNNSHLKGKNNPMTPQNNPISQQPQPYVFVLLQHTPRAVYKDRYQFHYSHSLLNTLQHSFLPLSPEKRLRIPATSSVTNFYLVLLLLKQPHLI